MGLHPWTESTGTELALEGIVFPSSGSRLAGHHPGCCSSLAGSTH